MSRVALIPAKAELIVAMARILGPSSAAYKAQEEYTMRHEAGEHVRYYMIPETHMIIVGPWE